jgi:hypothetical protein
MQEAKPRALDRPVCHYTGKWCEHFGTQACTCTLPGFVGEPPKWPVRDFRAALDKCDGLSESDKVALLQIAFAGVQYVMERRAAIAAASPL